MKYEDHIYLKCRGNLKHGVDFQSEDACTREVLLEIEETAEEIKHINWNYELRQPLFRKGDFVFFEFSNGSRQWLCRGKIAVVDIYRVNGKIEKIEYDIDGWDYTDENHRMYYKHIDESFVRKISDNMI